MYAARHEMAMTVNDVIARRMRLAFLDQRAARAALARVIALMAEELKWSSARIEKEKKEAEAFLQTMHLPPKV